jgi:hypothetical protein
MVSELRKTMTGLGVMQNILGVFCIKLTLDGATFMWDKASNNN